MFFNLFAIYKNRLFSIDHEEDNDCFQAPECEKIVALKRKAASFKIVADPYQLTFVWVPDHVARDVSRSQPLFCIVFCDFKAEQASASMPEVIDLAWLHIEKAERAETVFNMAGSRVWYFATRRDVSGVVTLGINKKHVLTFCCASDKNFQRKHSEGPLNMPLFCHARV